VILTDPAVADDVAVLSMASHTVRDRRLCGVWGSGGKLSTVAFRLYSWFLPKKLKTFCWLNSDLRHVASTYFPELLSFSRLSTEPR